MARPIIPPGRGLASLMQRAIQPVFEIGDETTNVINVGISFGVKTPVSVYAWLSDAAGGAVAAAAPSGGVAVGTDGAIIEQHTANRSFEFITDSDGVIDLDITEVGAATWYLNIRLPGGTVVSSEAIEFAA